MKMSPGAIFALVLAMLSPAELWIVRGRAREHVIDAGRGREGAAQLIAVEVAPDRQCSRSEGPASQQRTACQPWEGVTWLFDAGHDPDATTRP
jgi:hypothetical protein